VLRDLGLAHTLEGDLDGALAAFDASLALQPDARTRANLERVKAERARTRAEAR
jgi:lipoprotein NlpI